MRNFKCNKEKIVLLAIIFSVGLRVVQERQQYGVPFRRQAIQLLVFAIKSLLTTFSSVDWASRS